MPQLDPVFRIHWVMGFEMRTASHSETLIRSRKRKERLGLV